MKAILIPVDEETPIVLVEYNHENESVGLRELQRLVGGHLEALPYPHNPKATLYVDEEGKFKIPVKYNMRATELVAGMLGRDDFIAGTMIVCGIDPNTGETTDCPVTIEDVEKLIDA